MVHTVSDTELARSAWCCTQFPLRYRMVHTVSATELAYSEWCTQFPQCDTEPANGARERDPGAAGADHSAPPLPPPLLPARPPPHRSSLPPSLSP
eukprot:2103306-Rhodomonas_salina.1